MVTVYTQPDCLPCKRVVRKMEERGIQAEVIDITRDKVAADYIKRCLHAKSTPVIEAPGFEPVLGYQPDKLKEILDAFGV